MKVGHLVTTFVLSGIPVQCSSFIYTDQVHLGVTLMHSRGVQCDSQSGHHLCGLRFSIVFVCPSRQMAG
jgi:hypothetical protein